MAAGLFYDDATSLLYNAGDTTSGQNFAQAYNHVEYAERRLDNRPAEFLDRPFVRRRRQRYNDLVYVTDTATNAVDIFNYSAGNRQVGTIAAPGGGASILGVLLDSHGKLWVSYSTEILIYNTDVGGNANSNPLLHTVVTNANAYGMAIAPERRGL